MAGIVDQAGTWLSWGVLVARHRYLQVDRQHLKHASPWLQGTPLSTKTGVIALRRVVWPRFVSVSGARFVSITCQFQRPAAANKSTT